ncbi:MAG: glycosyltransferase family 2 protein [Kiritimatiellales bacterium]|nr:glycosyltransferase family 2 protein [Kiritimatiellales bacterium]
MEFTIIIPAYNEAEGISEVLKELFSAINGRGTVIVIDDGSTDGTGAKAKEIEGVKVITHAYNKGYGAAIKTGVRAAKTEWVITYDADGQHTPDLIDKLLTEMKDDNDMVVGKREGYKGPLIRQPGKKILHMVANHLSDFKIPDLNSGLRAFRVSTFHKYSHLFPNGFSISTTSTVCFLRERLNVVYVPINIKPRTGKSTVRPSDAVKTLMLILRLTMLFSPLRLLLPLSIVSGLITLGLLIFELSINNNISDSVTALITLTGFLFFFGLLADQVAAVRREIHSS